MLTKFIFDDGWKGFDVSEQMERHLNFRAAKQVQWDIRDMMRDVIYEFLPRTISLIGDQFTDEVGQAQLEFFRQWSRRSN